MKIFTVTVLITSSKDGIKSLGTKLFSSKEKAKSFLIFYFKQENVELSSAPSDGNATFYTGEKTEGDDQVRMLGVLEEQEILA